MSEEPSGYDPYRTYRSRVKPSPEYPACHDFQNFLLFVGVQASMSRSGCCYENAVMESFFHTLKTEFVHHEKFITKQGAKDAIFEWIEVFYNREPIRSSINYKTPVAFEAEFMQVA